MKLATSTAGIGTNQGFSVLQLMLDTIRFGICLVCLQASFIYLFDVITACSGTTTTATENETCKAYIVDIVKIFVGTALLLILAQANNKKSDATADWDARVNGPAPKTHADLEALDAKIDALDAKVETCAAFAVGIKDMSDMIDFVAPKMLLGIWLFFVRPSCIHLLEVVTTCTTGTDTSENGEWCEPSIADAVHIVLIVVVTLIVLVFTTHKVDISDATDPKDSATHVKADLDVIMFEELLAAKSNSLFATKADLDATNAKVDDVQLQVHAIINIELEDCHHAIDEFFTQTDLEALKTKSPAVSHASEDRAGTGIDQNRGARTGNSKKTVTFFEPANENPPPSQSPEVSASTKKNPAKKPRIMKQTPGVLIPSPCRISNEEKKDDTTTYGFGGDDDCDLFGYNSGASEIFSEDYGNFEAGYFD
ncbi:expressed unknown protein [Seminavis robusta]|uniref:Uncharacterized protein n=1 Tax=Seminavis robusta TaxID=568900 RepID=A0A9N8H9C7_9STRA|nr:expressed unknown protein [Seminavis robusta]|eukprot:Sro201_g085020.1 n/a (424) ;mRNA; r:31155-32426